MSTPWPDGLVVTRGALDGPSRNEMLGFVQLVLEGVPESGNGERSRVKRYGWDYLKPGKWLGEAPWAFYPKAMPGVWDHESVTVNEYPVGHGLALHKDAAHFEEPVVVLSLGAPATMLFEHAGVVVRVPVNAGTQVVMEGESLRKWQHGMEADNPDTRWSIVYRRRAVGGGATLA